MSGPTLELRQSECATILIARLIATSGTPRSRSLNALPMLVDLACERSCRKLIVDVAQFGKGGVSSLLASLVVTSGYAEERGIELEIHAGPGLSAFAAMTHLEDALPISVSSDHTDPDISILRNGRRLDFSDFARRNWTRSLRRTLSLET